MKTKLISFTLTIIIILAVMSLGSATANISSNDCDYYGYSYNCIDDTDEGSSSSKKYVPKVYTFGKSYFVDKNGSRIIEEEIINLTRWDLKNETELAEYNNETEVMEKIVEIVEVKVKMASGFYYKLVAIIILLIFNVVLFRFIYRKIADDEKVSSYDMIHGEDGWKDKD